LGVPLEVAMNEGTKFLLTKQNGHSYKPMVHILVRMHINEYGLTLIKTIWPWCTSKSYSCSQQQWAPR